MTAVPKSPPPRNLRLTPATAAPVRDRGRLLRPAEVAKEIFGGLVGRRWVLENAPAEMRVALGRLICFREADMRAWYDTLTAVGGIRG